MIRSWFLPLVGWGAASAALMTFAPCPEAQADLVQTVDGAWFPAQAGLGPDDEPDDAMLRESAEFKVDATYETVSVKNKGFSKPAGQVKRIFASDRATNSDFGKALVSASSDFFVDAAEGFAAAAAALSGYGKQEALYFCMQAWANAGEAEKAIAAAADVLAAYPKSYFFCDIAFLRARVAGDDMGGVKKALGSVPTAPGMNNRDLLRAEYMRIWMTEERARQYDKARESYLRLIADVEKTAAAEAAVTRQQALVGVGNCLVRTKKNKEAEEFFVKAAKESRNPDVLAGAYDGLGNIAFGVAKEFQLAGKLPEAKAKLEDAAEQYLRVTLLYKTQVDDLTPVLDAYENQAHVFVALFDMSGSKDCPSAIRAYQAYYDLQNMMQPGIQRTRLQKEGKEFGERKKAACGG